MDPPSSSAPNIYMNRKETLRLVTAAAVASSLASCNLYINSEGPNATAENPTNTLNPSLTPDWQQTVNAAVAATITEQAQQTLIAKGQVISPTDLTPTKLMAQTGLAVIPQELPANNFREGAQTESEVWKNIFGNLKVDYAKKDSLKGANSMLTTLTNMPAKTKGKIDFSKVFGKDPKTEPGLGHTDKDIDNYRNIYELTDDTTLLLSLARSNENKLITVGFYGNTNDRDAISYLGAAWIVAMKHPIQFLNVTVGDLKAGRFPSGFEDEIVKTQNEILKGIQKQFLDPSDEEKARRKNQTDGTSQIPEKFWKSDQYITCPVYMQNADTKELQYQGVRQVTYTNGGEKTFTTADSGQAGSLMAFSYDEKTQTWGVRSVGNRYYPPNKYDTKLVYTTTANGEQEIVCAVITPKPTRAPIVRQADPGQTSRPGETPRATPNPSATAQNPEPSPTTRTEVHPGTPTQPPSPAPALSTPRPAYTPIPVEPTVFGQ